MAYSKAHSLVLAYEIALLGWSCNGGAVARPRRGVAALPAFVINHDRL